LNRPCVKDLDVEITRMFKKIKLPDSNGLEAAAAKFGAQRAAAISAAAAVDNNNDLLDEEVPVDEEDQLCWDALKSFYKVQNPDVKIAFFAIFLVK